MAVFAQVFRETMLSAIGIEITAFELLGIFSLAEG